MVPTPLVMEAKARSRAGVEDVEIVGAVVIVVSEAGKVRVDFRGDVLLGVFDRDGEVAVIHAKTAFERLGLSAIAMIVDVYSHVLSGT